MQWIIPLATIIGILLGAIGAYTWFALSKPDNRAGQSVIDHLGKAVLALSDDDRDGAMDALSVLMNQTTDNIDAYLALSKMYRDKGWFHRAIDIRRRLLARGILDHNQRRAIMIGMVIDYQKAGLLGRAINAMKTVIEMTDCTAQDHELLATLYEQAGRYHDAAESWKKSGHEKNYAFVRTEIARQMVKDDDLESARKHLVQTLRIDRDNPAALMILADILARTDKITQAEKLFDRLQKIRPDLTGVIADTLEDLATETQNSKTQAFFIDLLEKQCHRPRVAVRFAGYLSRLERLDEARAIVEHIDTEELAPEMMARLVDISYRCGAVDAAARYGLETIQRFLDNKAFVCHACKELVFGMEWKCPKCGRWGTIRSRRSYSLPS
ncbi:tetratricopeptide repeat protein [bacterium]|nr:tetratricopeptide repeat protein [candidate division CSSED10-310 bacterium]